jgi:predicted nuclease with TOPRIM domain
MTEISNPPNRGDFVSLREYLESRIAAVEKGIEVANRSMQERLQGMNEFRDTLKDQAGRFVTRDELDSKMNNVNEQLKGLQYFKAQLEGKASQTQANIILLISIVSLAVSIVGLFS